MSPKAKLAIRGASMTKPKGRKLKILQRGAARNFNVRKSESPLQALEQGFTGLGFSPSLVCAYQKLRKEFCIYTFLHKHL